MDVCDDIAAVFISEKKHKAHLLGSIIGDNPSVGKRFCWQEIGSKIVCRQSTSLCVMISQEKGTTTMTKLEDWITCRHSVKVLKNAGIETVEQLSRLSHE